MTINTKLFFPFINLLLISLFLETSLDTTLWAETFPYELFFVFLLNLLITLILVKAKDSAIIFSFAGLLSTVSWIILLLFSDNAGLIGLSDVLIAFFPVILQIFFINFTAMNNFKKYRYLLLIQLVLAFMDLILPLFSASFSFRYLIFFINLFSSLFFCILIYRKESIVSRPLPKKTIKLILWSMVFSFTPFIFISLFLSLFIYQSQTIQNTWTLYFIIILPLTIAYILTKENQVVHGYWTLSMVSSFLLALLCAVTVDLMLVFSLDISLLEVVKVNHYLLLLALFFFSLTDFFIQFRQRKLNQIISDFDNERKGIFQQLMYDRQLESIWKIAEELINSNMPTLGTAIIWDEEPGSSYLLDKAGVFDSYKNELILRKSNLLNEKYKLFSMNDLHCLVAELRVEERSLGRVVIAGAHPISFSPKDIVTALAIADKLADTLFISSYLVQNQQTLNSQSYTSAEKGAYIKQLNLAEKRERELSLYLHDDVLQSIRGIKTIAQLSDDPELLIQALDVAIDNLERSLRSKMIDLSPSFLESISLKKSIETLTARLIVQFQTFIRVVIQIDIDEQSDLTSQNKIILYRIIKELLTNSFKHSGATEVIVKLTKRNNSLHLTVADNGIGIDITESYYNEVLKNHLGLISIKQQASFQNGTFQIDSTVKKGVRVSISLPV